jgi:twitching motility protein PilI
MARRVSLREFQESLASRMKAAAGEPASSARLSFEAEGTLWLLRLESSGELLPVPQIDHVPLTRAWFLGVANVRGVLFGVTDFSAFIAGAPTRRGGENRLLLVGQPYGINAALLVSRLRGLHNLAEFEPLGDQQEPGEQWVERAWRDRDGRAWRELDTAKLLAHRDFLDVAAP